MKVSLKTEYACRVLAQLARRYDRKELAHIESLAQAEDIPANYLVQILNDLRNSGLILSRRGKQGGYQLARDPSALSLLDILNAMEGELLAATPKPSGQSGEKVGASWKEMAAAMEEKARSIRLVDMVPEEADEMYYI